jgi:hypothetical protein
MRRACAFDLLRFHEEDLRRKPLSERKAALLELLGRKRDGIHYVAHAEMPGDEAFQAACELGLEGIETANRALQVGALQKLDQGRQSEVAGISVRIIDGTF